MKPVLQFWFDFASTYSYLAAMRVEMLAEKAGVKVEWQPFLLGPIFNKQGWSSSPFTVYPAKGAYMVRDMERLCAARDLPFHMPPVFPAQSLLANRVGLIAIRELWGNVFVKAVFHAAFGEGRDIGDESVLRDVLTGLDQNGDHIFVRAVSQENKETLRAVTEQAENLGIFGAPTFVSPENDLFWGDDRLEMAIEACNRA